MSKTKTVKKKQVKRVQVNGPSLADCAVKFRHNEVTPPNAPKVYLPRAMAIASSTVDIDPDRSVEVNAYDGGLVSIHLTLGRGVTQFAVSPEAADALLIALGRIRTVVPGPTFGLLPR